MSRASVRAAAGAYLGFGATSGRVPFLSAVFPHPPKLTNESDFYSLQLPGKGSGALIYLYLGPHEESRFALGARSPTLNAYVGGMKWRPYSVALMCYLRSVKTDAEDADTDNDTFIDGLLAWIQADRNLGTAPGQGQSGIVPVGAIFQAGEGGMHGGPDLHAHSLLPRLDKARGTITVFTTVSVTVCEVLNT